MAGGEMTGIVGVIVATAGTGAATDPDPAVGGIAARRGDANPQVVRKIFNFYYFLKFCQKHGYNFN
jgi:hypothetical protein